MSGKVEEIIAESADPEGGGRELARFEDAYEAAAGGPFEWKAKGARTLARIFGNSPALAAKLIAHPEWAHDIARSKYISKRKPVRQMQREIAPAADCEDQASFMKLIRHFKYREMARIVARDLEGSAHVRDLLAEWSDVADVIIEAAWLRSHAMTASRHGEPLSGGAVPLPCPGCVIALGKLGGRELNLSSDVDLMIVYSTDDGGTGRITNHEFYVEQAALFTKLLAKVTDDGFAFRVDHDLRPEGPQGPLANSLDAAERYYEYFGHGWERQALIRARCVAGDAELGARFIDAVRPFVYRRSMSLSDIAHMQRMKREMERSSHGSGGSFDIKHGSGGIREVEFLVQAMGLLFGGQVRSIRTGNTFEAIEALARESLIHPYGKKALMNAYAFLRRAENMLQAAGDRQTHRLPRGAGELAKLARRMGYPDADRFRTELEGHRQAAGSLFDAIFSADYERQELMGAIRDNAARAETEEERIESLAWFKGQEVKRIQELDLTRGMPLARVMERLTLTAEATIACAWEIASAQLRQRHGAPRLKDGGPAGFAVVGMGSLGSREVDYGSDLDLCFIHAGAGATDGAGSISNAEYFTKLSQRIISMLTMPCRYGRAYSVDSELRPSGRAGTLVATLDSFKKYHGEEAELWERQSLMKARAIAGDAAFLKPVRETIDELAFGADPPSPQEIRDEIVRLRTRTMDERASGRTDVYELKIGRGGLADVEAVIQMHQLLYAADDENLREQNAGEVLDALRGGGHIDDGLFAELADHLAFYRRLISRIRLALGRAADVYSKAAPYAKAVAEQMGAAGPEALAATIDQHMKAMAAVFDEQVAKPRP